INEFPDFVYQPKTRLYTSQYTDAVGNRWRVDVKGTKELLAPFLAQKPILLQTERITPEQITDLLHQLNVRTTPVTAEETVRPAENLPNLPADVTPNNLRPSFQITFSLERVNADTAYHTKLQVDPPLTKDHSATYTFHQIPGLAQVTAGYTEQEGQVWVSAYKGGDCKDRSNSIALTAGANQQKRLTPTNTSWCVKVTFKRGNSHGQAKYTLLGNFWGLPADS
ncbi:MAG: hypothetical protein M3Z04_23600, partial [Chloroflexota bacterium]|nr:hypothetical protein [Chloroflexota bacterium]